MTMPGDGLGHVLGQLPAQTNSRTPPRRISVGGFGWRVLKLPKSRARAWLNSLLSPTLSSTRLRAASAGQGGGKEEWISRTRSYMEHHLLKKPRFFQRLVSTRPRHFIA